MEFCPKSCNLRPSSNLFYENNAVTRADLPCGTVPGACALMVRHLVASTYVWAEDVAKILKVPGALSAI